MEITERTIATAREKGVEQLRRRAPGGRDDHHARHRPDAARSGSGCEARLQDPHLAVAKGAALFALMRKVKESCRTAAGSAGRAVQKVADQLGMSAERGRGHRRPRRVATVVPRAFGIKVVDGADPVFQTDPDKARHYVEHLLIREHPTASRHRAGDVPHDRGQPAPGAAGGLGAGRRGRLGGTGAQHSIGEGMLSDLPRKPAGAPFQVIFHMTETGLLQVHGWEADSGSEVRFEIQIGRLDEGRTRQASRAVSPLRGERVGWPGTATGTARRCWTRPGGRQRPPGGPVRCGTACAAVSSRPGRVRRPGRPGLCHTGARMSGTAATRSSPRRCSRRTPALERDGPLTP